MDIENGTWVQLKSDTSKVYCINSVSDEFIEGVSSNGERTTLNVNEVEFKGGKTYSSSYASAGTYNVEQMKNLALNGAGLSAYITRNARFNYER